LGGEWEKVEILSTAVWYFMCKFILSAISTWFGEAPTIYGIFAFLFFEFQVLPVRISGSISS